MLDYTLFFEKTPTVILNVPGKITIDNKGTNYINFEIDYNSFSEETIYKIKNGKEDIFKEITNCITYDENKKLNNYIMVAFNNNGNKEWHKALSENNTINFSMIKYKIEIFKNDNRINIIGPIYSKTVNVSLGDGIYTFKITIYNTEDEIVFNNDILVEMKTNYYKLDSNKSEDVYINFDKEEGDFRLLLSANSKRLYSFKINDIETDNDNIFEFSFYNMSSNDKRTIGKIGAELHLLNQKQIDEIIKTPQLEKLINPRFAFEINELFTSQHSKNDIGVIKFPTIREKIKDTYLSYYNLSCDVTQNYSVDFDKSDDLLVTDKFNNYPLFYKFFIDTPFDSIKIIDSDNKEITDFVVEDISDEVHIVYFNPLRNKEYYYILDNDPPLHIRYKRSIEAYRMIFNKELENNNNKLEFEYPMYFGDLMLKGNGEYEIEIQLSDYTRKKFKLKAVDKEFKFLEDERVKINNKIISLSVNTKDKIEVISMICNFKHNRTNYSYFKSNFKDFVYIAQPVGELNIEDIPDTELSKFNLNNRYILKNGLIEEVHNGPLYLEDINKTDIVFTDIEEWLKEQSIDNVEIIKTGIKDKFFLENVLNPVREVKYEDK